MKKIGLILGLIFFLCMSSMAQDEWQPVTSPIEVFSKGYIQVIGSSEEGQSRYRAIRAATVVAQRNLLEVLQGIRLYGNTNVKDGMLQSENIRTSVQGVLRGAVRCGEKYYPNGGYAEVCMRLYLRGHGGLYDVIIPLIKKENLLPEQNFASKPNSTTITGNQSQYNLSTEKKYTAITPSKVENPYDGLVVDVRGLPFRPAIINRILNTQGRIIFDPSEVVSSILVERGCGGFTNNEAKAIALLKSWGSKHPLEIKAIKILRNTDVVVGNDEATLIFASNEKTQFLNQARVVFLLK